MWRFIFFFATGAWAVTPGPTEDVRIWPENPVVEFGGSLVLNCTSICENIGLETAYTKVPFKNGSSWKAFHLSNVNYWAPSPLCFANCKSGQKTSQKANITIYKSPDHIKLDTIPKMEVGKLYNLTCQVSKVAPIRDLTVTLLKGEELLLVKTFENRTDRESGAVVVYHPIRAQKNDHNKTVTCQTSLDLRPSGPLLKNTSHNITLESFDFAEVPLLHTNLFLEAGTKTKVTCEAADVSPAEEAIFDLWFAGKSLTFNTSVMGAVASAQAVVTASSVGDHELNCTVSLGPVTKTVNKTVNVFALPKPTLQIDNSEALVNQTVNIACRADGNASPGFTMQIREAAKILASSYQDQHFLQHAVITQQEDNGREFICQVTLIIDGHTKERNISQKLIVFYGPQIDYSNCPHTLTWKEGSTTSFSCSALGNPTPTVQCQKDGRSYNIGEPQLVQSEHDGIYHCNATNQYGFDVRDVTVHVESSQPNNFAIIIGIIIVVVLLIFLALGCALYNKKKSRIYHLWKQQRPPSQATGISEELMNNTTHV